MPFVSEKQKKYLYVNKPNVAAKFAKDSKNAKIKKGYKLKPWVNLKTQKSQKLFSKNTKENCNGVCN